MSYIIKIENYACKGWNWIFSIPIKEREKKDALGQLQLSIRVTAKCRFNAATRLYFISQFSFITTTFLSLGLIFIPLMTTSGIKLAFSSSVLNMMQIFLAVAVLVFSVVNATARYDVRSEKFTNCGNRLKDLNRFIETEKIDTEKFNKEYILRQQEKYSDIVADSENHKNVDFKSAMLEMKYDYYISGLPKLKLFIVSRFELLLPYLVPISLLMVELIFITDMFSLTKIFTKYLNGNAI